VGTWSDTPSTRFDLVADLTGDGQFTISDIWHWLGWLFHCPGDGAIYLFVHHASSWARFLEISLSDYGGFLSGLLSVFAWMLAHLPFALLGGDSKW